MTADPTIVLLEDLVAIDSVNPGLVPGARGEAEVAKRIALECLSYELNVHVTEVAPGRPNVVAVLDSGRSGPTLMYCGHMDTVGVAGMASPFVPERRGNLLYGRGTQDMKGGLAAMLGAARVLAGGEGLGRGRLVVAAVVDEEHMSLGAEALVAEWSADAAVVAEPTDLQVAIAHKGFEWVEIETRGRAAHGSAPADGRDAILRMGRVLIALESLDRRLQSKAPHPLLGSPSLHASVIAGGGELSSYPDRCTLRVERRTLPGESGQAGLTEARVILERLREDDCDFQGHASHVFSRPAYEIAPSHPLPGMLQVAAESAGRSVVATGMPYWTDAAILGGAGVPTVLFGPGGSGLHGPDEHVKVDEVIECRNALVAFARLYLRG